MKHKIISLDVLDIRYPTVRLGMAGSDPRHLAPNYSCAIPILSTDTGLEGRSLIFTIGDGTQIQVAAVEALRRFVVGRSLDEFIAEPGLFAQALTEHHQLRWLALGTYRMAVGGIVNALWDLWAKSAGVPMWRLLTSLPPEKIVQCIDFHHLRDALTEDELLEMLQQALPHKQANIDRLERQGPKIYSTAGWSGRPLAEVSELCRDLYAKGTRACARIGIEVAAKRGAGAVLVLPADLPLLRTADLRRLLAAGAEDGVVVAADRHDRGTNALLLRPATAMPALFGPGSFTAHVAAARRHGLKVRAPRIANIRLDVDTADDLRLLRQKRRIAGPRTAAVLRALG